MSRLSRLSFSKSAAALAAFFIFSGGALAIAAVVALQPDAAAGTVLANPPPGIDAAVIAQPVTMPADPRAAAQIRRGEYLATAGDCQYCHSIPGGAPYAGAQPVQTPFGDLMTPNITPDKRYGIGNWTDAQFYRALHLGIEPGNSLLVFPRYMYPLMPWQNYNKLSYPDVMAIKAYLDSLPPVAQADRPTQMAFPFTIRAGLLAWRLLFFNNAPIQYDPSWSPQVRNGAFIVEALAHCTQCHTPRNLLMATEASRYLAGGHILAQSWYAPNISSDQEDGVGGWRSQDLVDFLYRGGKLGVAGSPYGPMKSVVDDSLSRLPVSDVQDIAAYLQTAVPAKKNIEPAARPGADLQAGGQIFSSYCARCHGDNGEGVNNNFPNLAGNQSVWSGKPNDVISMVLGGYSPWHKDQSNMPEFNQILSDGQIAAVTNYVRTSWGNKGPPDATAPKVATLRDLASDWAMLSTATTQASLKSGGTTAYFNDISGKFEMFSEKNNCMVNGTFGAGKIGGAATSMTLAGSCDNGGGALDATIIIDGTPYPAKLQVQDFFTAGHLSGVRISGTPAGSKQFLDLRVSFMKPSA